ncbi:MAG: NTP transferase domain-containing protein [Patescibacteria group bacterium]
MKIKKHKIIFTAQDPGGFNAIAPVIKSFEKDARFDVSVILAKHACIYAEKQNIKYLNADKTSFDISGADLIFTGTSFGDSIEKKIIFEAKEKGIPTISIVDFWTDYTPSFSDPEKRNFKYLPDYILAVDEIMKKEMEAEGFPKNKIFITGNPSFDSFDTKLNKKADKNLITFFCQPMSELYKKDSKDYKNATKFSEVKVFYDIVEAIEKIDLNKKIIIDFHPRAKKLNKFDKIIKKSKLKIEKNIKPYGENSVKNPEIIIGMSTVVLFEAALAGKKVLSYQPGLKKKIDYLASNRLGLSLPVYKKEDLYLALKRLIFQKSKAKNLKLIKKYTQNNSTQKVINFINDILKKNQKKKLKIVACIQARIGSKRLKGKALLKIAGKSLIESMFCRLKAAKEIDDIILSTADNKENDILAKHAEKIGLKYYRGSEKDLISRHYGAIKKLNADAMVLVTGDCPLVDPKIVDNMVAVYRNNPKKFDFLTNTFPPTFPHGLDMDIIPASTFEKIDKEVKFIYDRECFAAYIMKNPRKFKIFNMRKLVNLSSIRLTLDYKEDLILIRKIFEALGNKKRVFDEKDILNFLRKNPEILKINKNRINTVLSKNIRL